MKSKNKIFDSFEEFLSLPLSILKKRIIQITGYRSDFITRKSIDVELDDNVIRINCINSQNAYNLLSSVIYKKKMMKKAQLQESNKQIVDNTLEIVGKEEIAVSSVISQNEKQQKEENKKAIEKKAQIDRLFRRYNNN